MQIRKPRISPLVGTMVVLLLLGGQIAGAAAASAIPMPPGGPGVPITKLPRVDPTHLKAGAPAWPWLTAAAVGIVFITVLAVHLVARSRMESGHRQPKAPLGHARRPSPTH